MKSSELCFDEEDLWYMQLDIEIKALKEALKVVQSSKSLKEAEERITELIKQRGGM